MDIPNEDELLHKYVCYIKIPDNEFIINEYRICGKCGKNQYREKLLLGEYGKWNKYISKKKEREQKLNNIFNTD
jgi:hypothetical protein